MKHFIFIFFTLLFSSCYKNVDLNEYDEYYGNRPNPSEYFWYYDKELFGNAEYCQLVGELKSPYCEKSHNINRQCHIYDYTIYPIKRYNAIDFCPYCHTEHNIYAGTIIIDSIEHFVNIKLN